MTLLSRRVAHLIMLRSVDLAAAGPAEGRVSARRGRVGENDGLFEDPAWLNSLQGSATGVAGIREPVLLIEEQGDLALVRLKVKERQC